MNLRYHSQISHELDKKRKFLFTIIAFFYEKSHKNWLQTY